MGAYQNGQAALLFNGYNRCRITKCNCVCFSWTGKIEMQKKIKNPILEPLDRSSRISSGISWKYDKKWNCCNYDRGIFHDWWLIICHLYCIRRMPSISYRRQLHVGTGNFGYSKNFTSWSSSFGTKRYENFSLSCLVRTFFALRASSSVCSFSEETSALESLTNGAVISIKVIAAIVANLIVYVALITMVDVCVGWMGSLVGHPEISFTVRLYF